MTARTLTRLWLAVLALVAAAGLLGPCTDRPATADHPTPTWAPAPTDPPRSTP